ncbi:unnamed protein product [Angiostrongylus costaricensis]|uniref:Glycylpeptide N-tetradecanoyltransferase n=1 Tax=Angiostrongylus costaricensis TaxID=334426 RepID=A0A0R3PNZ3_ANGCS|nr:unnamed protein product [Angiostrongylus costaricensis]
MNYACRKEHVIFENGKTFLCHPWLYGFNEKDCPDVGDGKRLFPGTQKSVHFIEGQRGRGFASAALVIDAKKAAFHEDLRLIDKAKIILNDSLSRRVSEVALERLNFGMKGILLCSYRSYFLYRFEMQDGVKVSVLQYFKEKYKICLEYPHAPLVKVREGSRVNNYPMELGFIRAMQRVTISQQTPAQTHKTTKVGVPVVKERRKVTVENIILKTNMKLGGLNYVDFTSCSDVFWIFKHFQYASNFKENVVDFVGDYLFQSSGREEVPLFADHHGGRFPGDLIIYRSGISDGSFKTVLTHEIPLLRGTLSALGVKNIKLTFVVVQKKHNIRLMNTHIDRSRKIADQNIPPGVVVDSNVTHPAFKEFYLNSHITLQGSAITPRYTVLVDDLNFSMDELEGITYVLTYAHQIVNLSTSIPTPLYVAHSYAERGRNNHESGESIDYGRIAQRLSYRNTKLEDIRINA